MTDKKKLSEFEESSIEMAAFVIAAGVTFGLVWWLNSDPSSCWQERAIRLVGLVSQVLGVTDIWRYLKRLSGRPPPHRIEAGGVPHDDHFSEADLSQDPEPEGVALLRKQFAKLSHEVKEIKENFGKLSRDLKHEQAERENADKRQKQQLQEAKSEVGRGVGYILFGTVLSTASLEIAWLWCP